jgi:hypothetical protein
LEEQARQGGRGLNDGLAERAGSLLRQALGLQRGQAFGEFFDSDVAVAEADRLAELGLDSRSRGRWAAWLVLIDRTRVDRRQRFRVFS